MFGLIWALVFWLPVSGIIPIPSARLADRFLYTVAIGIWIIIADQTVRFFPSGTRLRRYNVLTFAFALLLLAGLTIVKNRDWESDITLFSRQVEQYPDHPYGHYNLGSAYLDKKDLDAAEAEFNKALALDPFYPRLRTLMGYIRLLRGDYEGAIQNYNEAIKQNQLDVEALFNRAMAMDKLGWYQDAAVNYERFLSSPGSELYPHHDRAAGRLRELSPGYKGL